MRSGTPAPLVQRLSRELHDIVQTADFKKRYDDIGAFTVGNTPEEFDKVYRDDRARFARVIKEANIPLQD